jgi:hypothetical protein
MSSQTVSVGVFVCGQLVRCLSPRNVNARHRKFHHIVMQAVSRQRVLKTLSPSYETNMTSTARTGKSSSQFKPRIYIYILTYLLIYILQSCTRGVIITWDNNGLPCRASEYVGVVEDDTLLTSSLKSLLHVTSSPNNVTLPYCWKLCMEYRSTKYLKSGAEKHPFYSSRHNVLYSATR